MIQDIANYTFGALLIAVSCAWCFLLYSMLETFRRTPRLDSFEKGKQETPKVSVILPARNEEEFIGRCLDSLSTQDYENYEIIVIDDSSEDRTAEIIKEHAARDARIIHVSARPKPAGWMGKNWACMEGYKKAGGQLLLFTDADTRHAKNVITLSVGHLLSLKLDALTVIPRLLALDTWTRITLPMICTFLHTRFSALKVNDPSKNTGYFFGSFFIIKKETYEQVGTHEGVREEIIEDGALGKKVKESGHALRMVRGEHLVDAVWARDGKTLWSALKRLMVPLSIQSPKVATGIFFAVLFLLFVPFVLLAYSLATFGGGASSGFILAASVAASALVYAGAFVESRELRIRLQYAILCPIGGLVVALGFLSGLIQANRGTAVSWRDRKYSIKPSTQNAINI